jgi:serine/threonine protein kinase
MGTFAGANVASPAAWFRTEKRVPYRNEMGLRPEPMSDDDSMSVTDLGEPALVRASSLEIARGAVLAGRYQVEAVIGKGGSGIVLRAFDRIAQVPVAVKILKPELATDPRWVERFSRELRLARQIQHPNVCRVFDIGQADGHWFITMELATAGTLRDQLAPGTPLRPLTERLNDMRAVVDGLAAIHDAGIVHRDLKPDNFLRMNDGRLVLSDFGLATNPADAPFVSILVGTPSYMAPEVVLGEQASLQSDVWSLGVVFHEILFGHRPRWESTSSGRTLVRPPQRSLPAVERILLSLIEECLQEDGVSRPTQGRDVLLRFESALQAKRWPRPRSSRATRSRWAWPAAAVACAILAAVASGRWWRTASAGSAGRRSTIHISSPQGTAKDWAKATSIAASFRETVHCMSWLKPDHVLRLIVGEPRRAIDLDIATKIQREAPLAAETFSIGCPQRSSRGDLLFERFDNEGRHEIMLSPPDSDGHVSKPLTLGSAPVWLPSGSEFVFSADDTHAAVFSVPVMTTSIISETPEDGGILLEKVVATDGKSVALRYMDRSFLRHLVIHGLPSLSVLNAVVFDGAATDFGFWGKAGQLIFALDDTDGKILAELDIPSGIARRLGVVADRSLGTPTRGIERLAITSYRLNSDIWMHHGGQRTIRLTTDGRSFHPDLSEHGDLIAEYVGSDGSLSIHLFEKGTPPRAVTNGPRDVTPSFLPDGTGWLYVDGARLTIRRCKLSGACQDVHTTADFPFFPVASPDQERIAYLTVIGRQRVMVVDPAGGVRDLGPARPECPPHWAAANRIWVLQGTDKSPAWAEIDATTGEQLESKAIANSDRNETHDCPFLSPPPAALHRSNVAAWASEETEVRILSD